jgi:hypothetical protein
MKECGFRVANCVCRSPRVIKIAQTHYGRRRNFLPARSKIRTPSNAHRTWQDGANGNMSQAIPGKADRELQRFIDRLRDLTNFANIRLAGAIAASARMEIFYTLTAFGIGVAAVVIMRSQH